jgi:hypothetical protein
MLFCLDRVIVRLAKYDEGLAASSTRAYRSARDEQSKRSSRAVSKAGVPSNANREASFFEIPPQVVWKVSLGEFSCTTGLSSGHKIMEIRDCLHCQDAHVYGHVRHHGHGNVGQYHHENAGGQMEKHHSGMSYR